jgi:mannose-1-phosphate guanylyltransferase
MTTLKAFLLVAGRGERLRPLTDTTPKCLLPINGTPLLQIWLEHLERSGIGEVLINTGWLAEQVRLFVTQWSVGHPRLKTTLFHEPVLLGSAGTLLANKRWAGSGPFFIIYGDNLTRINLQQMLAFHKKHGMPLTIRVYRGADPKRAGIVLLNDNDTITDFEEKPAKPKSDIGAGAIYIADNRLFAYFREKPERPLDLSCHILPRMTGKMKAYGSGEFSMDIGTPESLAAARKRWQALDDGTA